MAQDSKYITRVHHGRTVAVREDLMNTHRDVCMCYDCTKFTPGLPEQNCPIANLLFAVCLETGIVTPVFECPAFQQGARYPFKTETGQV
jgi:hypothetical protein